MAAVRVRIAASIHHRNFAIVPHVVQATQLVVESEFVVGLQHLLAFIQRRAQFLILIVAPGDDRIQPVVSTSEFHDDHDSLGVLLLAGLKRLSCNRKRGSSEDGR